jgi:glycosyltransferase involved in cell wall biosynthesis
MATLDILIPHYNDPEGLALSLDSISKQTREGKKRIVIVDDGSSQDAKNAVNSLVGDFLQMHGDAGSLKIDVLSNGINRGRPFTRNALLDSIDSRYVAWLDAGDEWYPTKLDAQFKSLERIEATQDRRLAWLTCNYDWRWLGGRTRKVSQKTKQDQHKALLIGNNLRAYLWTLLGSAESFKSVGYFDERLPRMQDLDYFIRFVSHGGVIHNLKGSRTHCVYHKSDVGRDADEIRACNDLIYDKHRVIFRRYGENFCKMRLYNMEMLAARFAQNNHDKAKARRYLLTAFRTRPIAFIKHVSKKGLSA